MGKRLLITLLFGAVAAGASAQAPAPGQTLRLTVDDAVRMALERNLDLNADRLDPQISDTRVAAAEGAFRPLVTSSVQRNNQLQPPINFLFPTATRTDAVTSTAGVSQRLGRFGTSYSVSWNAVHTDSNSILNSYNPLLQSGLLVGVSQPLVRGFAIDSARQQLLTSQVGRDIADTRLRESLVHTTADVKRAYWNLVSAIANVAARQSALDLANEFVRVNQAKVDAGQSPPLDLLAAQADAAADQEQLIIAQTAVKQLEDELRVLIFDPTDRAVWTVKIDPVEAPPSGASPPDVDAAITNALADRADLLRARKDTENAATAVKFSSNERLPDVRVNLSYQTSGLGGTQLVRTGGFPGTVIASGPVTDFTSVIGQLFAHDYPTWNVGVSVSYPVGASAEAANAARARLEERQSALRTKSAEARAIQQVRNAGWTVEMNAQRMQTTRTARELADERLDAERKRFDVGMSTNFLVIQAQRDLAQAKQNELAAVLAYDLSLVDFEALQQAGPRGEASAAPAGGTAESGGVPQSSTAPPAPAPTVSTGLRIPGL